MHVCSNSSSCHNVFILLSLLGVTTLSLIAGVCAACMLAYRGLQMKWWAAVIVVAIPSQMALLMCPYVSFSRFSVLTLRPSRALLHNLQPTSGRNTKINSEKDCDSLQSETFNEVPNIQCFTVSLCRLCKQNMPQGKHFRFGLDPERYFCLYDS